MIKFRIAFDLDGVVLHQDIGLLRLIDFVSQDPKVQEELNSFYYSHRELILNPIDFLSDDDKLFFITGRNKAYQKITEMWQKKYFPQATLIILNHEDPDMNTSMDAWYIAQAKLKAKALEENNIDVYFEDTPDVVKELRKLCPNIKIVQYGGRFIN